MKRSWSTTTCGRPSRGKRSRPEVRAFTAHLEENLVAMAAALRAGTFPVGAFRQFVIAGAMSPATNGTPNQTRHLTRRHDSFPRFQAH